MRLGYEIVSNAAERSRRKRVEVFLLVTILCLFSKVAMSAVSVLWLLLNLDCVVLRNRYIGRRWVRRSSLAL